MSNQIDARFEEGTSVDVAKYLEEHGNPEAAKEWEAMNEEHGDKFKTAGEHFAALMKMAPGNLPADVERYVKEIKEGNPDYDDAKAWATAWSRYCKYRNPGSPHCQRSPSEYFVKKAEEGLERLAAGELVNDIVAEPDNSLRKNPLDPLATWDEGEIDLTDDPRDHDSEGSMIPGLEDRLATEAREAMQGTAGMGQDTYLLVIEDKDGSGWYVKTQRYQDDPKAGGQILRSGLTRDKATDLVLDMADKWGVDLDHVSEWREVGLGRYTKLASEDEDPATMLAELALLAEGCPDNLDDAECKEWESNTEKYKDVVKDQHKEAARGIPLKQRAGTRVVIQANPASRMMYRRLPPDGTAGTVTPVALPGGRATYMPGPGGGLVYVQWDDGTFMGVSPIDLEYEVATKVATTIGKGKNGYLASWKGKQVEVMADTSYEAQTLAADYFKTRKSWEITVVLAEKGGHPVTHAPLFASEDEPASDEKEGKFEEGKPADPTENMSPEDAAEWEKQNEANKDKFKKDALAYVTFRKGDRIRIKPVPSGLRASYPANDIAQEMVVTVNEGGSSEGLDVYEVTMPDGSEEYVYGFQIIGKLPARLADDNLEAKWGAPIKTASAGLYGFTKGIQSSCESSIRKLSKAAFKIARDAYRKDEETAPFLAMHAKRGKSLPAKILVAAMKDLGPKVASVVVAAEKKVLPRERLTGRSVQAARKYGLYGFGAKTANLGLGACMQVRETAGHVASDLHGRKADAHEHIMGFLSEHAKQARCMYSKMLHASYPDADRRTASVKSPKTVTEWLAWED